MMPNSSLDSSSQMDSAMLPLRASRSRILALAVSSALGCAPLLAIAQDGPLPEEEIIVTATRRTTSIQEVPFNIAAVSGDTLAAQGVSDLAEIARTVPGLYVVDQGGRTANRIVVRGLNVSSITASEALGNDGGEIVSTYVGEIPLYIDLRPVDLERVEVLLGPQGTLYGAGTLGGAIRYIPKRPQFDAPTLDLRARGYGLAKSNGLGTDTGFTLNLPLAETIAVRASIDYLDDPGFIDYGYLVREPGVSDPEPDLSDPAARAANLRRDRDADDEQTLSGRIALRAQPLDALDVNLTYYYQDQETGGRSATSRTAFGTGRYEFATRYPEPNDRRNELLALELTADLGFAELTSATGYSKYREHGGRDQTDLLLSFEYGYEAFPSFSAFTREQQKDKRFNQELRLVSKTEGRFEWIVGGFYNHLKRDFASREYTPWYSEFLLDLDPTFGYRPDALEYVELAHRNLEERAIYGELQFHVTDRWQITFGARWYQYELKTRNQTATPLFDTVFFGGDPDTVDYRTRTARQKEDGELFKVNTSFDVTDDLMIYATVSEGYRIGGVNGAPACLQPLPPGQNICALPNELEFQPDTTRNYELGIRSELFDKRLTLNGSIYRIDWDDPQIGGATLNGLLPITLNGRGARSEGFELSFTAQLTEQLLVRGAYAHSKAELTKDAPALLRETTPPGFGTQYVDGEKGDRLPGSPRHQGSLWASYEVPWSSDKTLGIDYGLTAQSNVVTHVGGRAGGETLGGFAIHHASIRLRATAWEVGLYAENLFNKYAITGVRSTRRTIQAMEDMNGDPVRVRSYYQDVLRPREVGLRFSYNLDL